MTDFTAAQDGDVVEGWRVRFGTRTRARADGERITEPVVWLTKAGGRDEIVTHGGADIPHAVLLDRALFHAFSADASRARAAGDAAEEVRVTTVLAAHGAAAQVRSAARSVAGLDALRASGILAERPAGRG